MVWSNAGLSGCLVSVGSAGTSYGIEDTNLGNPCPAPPSPPPCCADEQAWRDAYAARMVRLRAKWAEL